MKLIGIILPILGLIGYANELWWLFYIAGGLVFLSDALAFLNGSLRCFGTLLTIIFWIGAYDYTGSIVDGVCLGSCASSIILMISTFVFIAVTAGFGAAIAGVLKFVDRFKS